MDKQGKWLAPILCAIMPLIPLSYLYSRNAEYVSALQVVVVGAGLAVFWLFIFGVLRLIFKSRLSALAGCLMALVFFVGMRSASGLSIFRVGLSGYDAVRFFLVCYLSAAFVAVLAVAFALRRRRGGQVYSFLLIFLGLMLAYNAVAAIRTGLVVERKDVAGDASRFKTQFAMSESAPSPNVYWFHCDGMLGFDAFEKYFGDDQAEFTQALAKRGFQINRSATVETTHSTKVAVPTLMCPYYYDNAMDEVLKDHETAAAKINTLSKYELQIARMQNETRLAFEGKGYLSQTFGNVNIWFPPVSNRVYTSDDKHAVLLETSDEINERYLPIIRADELVALLTGVPETTFLNLMLKLSERGWFQFGMRSKELTHTLTKEQLNELAKGKKLLSKSRLMLQAINDSTYVEQRTFDIVFYWMAHFPFDLDENGNPNRGDSGDIHAYAGQHRYAADMLIVMLDQILARDPDAVIVLQGDHGLHGQSREQITAAFGEEAVLPIWNQVMSALRVPEKYKSGEESFALSNPLNMSRYLVNSFVGRNYAYVE